MIRRMPTRSLAVERRSEARQRGPAPILAALLLLLFAAAVRVPVALGKDTEVARVTSGPLTASVSSEPFGLAFDAGRGTFLADAPSSDPSVTGTLGFRDATGWRQAVRVASVRQRSPRGPAVLLLDTDDPAGRRIELTVTAETSGAVALAAKLQGSTADVAQLGIAWRTGDDERFFGLGERADAVEHRGASVESYVSDGPYREDEYTGIGALLPPPGFRPRLDATYFPVPWLLSSRGYGVLVANDDTAYHDLGSERSDAWSLTVQGAPVGEPALPAPRELRFVVFAGPTPADALARFTAFTGRQPEVVDEAPWVLGPWYQPGGSVEGQVAQLKALHDADAPVSVAQTYLHYLPCGGSRASEPAKTAALHAQGVAVTTYFNPMVCRSYEDAFRHAERTGALIRNPDLEPYVYTYFTTRAFDVGQYDFSFGAGDRAFQQLLADAVADGHDGWMEDFGEYTPLDARPHDGRRGSAAHNRYVVDYHCAGWDFARKQQKPVVRFQRSGWTGAARCAQVVWGGDPTTDWGYDGLQSVVRAGLGMGLSGIGLWGSDIGGFFSFNGRRLTDELLTRWVQLGAVSGVMRTERDGIAVPEYERPQVDDPSQLANWRRYGKLRTQLQPYLAAAAEEYQRSGLPLMRHLVLAYPDDARVRTVDDEFLFGPDILAAPVLEQGATTRTAYLPDGRWVDFWRTIAFDEQSGAFHIASRATAAAGGREVEVPAPLDELPLFVRAGAQLPLLPADVDTLADFGDGAGGVVRLEDRRGERTLLAFPRGTSRARLAQGGLESSEVASGWQLGIDGPVTRWTIEASLATLERPFTPCGVLWRGKRLPDGQWWYDTASQVLHAVVTGTGDLVAQRSCS